MWVNIQSPHGSHGNSNKKNHSKFEELDLTWGSQQPDEFPYKSFSPKIISQEYELDTPTANLTVRPWKQGFPPKGKDRLPLPSFFQGANCEISGGVCKSSTKKGIFTESFSSHPKSKTTTTTTTTTTTPTTTPPTPLFLVGLKTKKTMIC